MAIIADHLKRNTTGLGSIFTRQEEFDYTPVCPWPEDCTVQWGSPRTLDRDDKDPIVVDGFFEAFPAQPTRASSYLRGEGTSIEEAERACFARYEREKECNHHWGRARTHGKAPYTNGYGWCQLCGCGQSNKFPVLVVLPLHRRAISAFEQRLLRDEPEMRRTNEEYDMPPLSPRLEQQLKILKMRNRLFGVASEQN